MLLRAVERYDDIMKVMLPTLGPERQATYSPFLPISPKTGRVLYVPMKAIDAKAGTITFLDEDGEETTLPVTGGAVKLQWKPDFGMRWAALNVDFEMFGKDHQTNAIVYDRICNILGGRAPEHFVYELFLDELGQKISKSKGNGITIDQWLTYAPTESLGLYMYQKPKTAKRLYFDVIPKAVDEYYTYLSAYFRQDWKDRLNNPVWHMHDGNPPKVDMPVPFSLLLNLVSASNAQNKDVLWGFISRYAKGASPETHPELDRLVGYAIRYFDDFVKPAKVFRPADDVEREALQVLLEHLDRLPADADGEAIQNASLNAARTIERYQDHSKKSPEGGPGVSGAFFQMIYQVLIGQERGPRFGSFAALYGIGETQGAHPEGAGRATRGLTTHSTRIGWSGMDGAGADGTADRPDVSGGSPKMPRPAACAFSPCLLIGAAGQRPGPAIRDQPVADILLAEPARRDDGGRIGLRRQLADKRAAPQPQSEGAAGTDAARPGDAMRRAGLVRRKAACSGDRNRAVHRIRTRRTPWRPAGRTACRSICSDGLGGGGRARLSWLNGSRGASRSRSAALTWGGATTFGATMRDEGEAAWRFGSVGSTRRFGQDRRRQAPEELLQPVMAGPCPRPMRPRRTRSCRRRAG